MKSRKLIETISTILGLSKRKRKEFYDVLETIDEEGKTQADYDENDINSPSYIKNRPFCENYEGVAENINYPQILLGNNKTMLLQIALDFNNNKILYDPMDMYLYQPNKRIYEKQNHVIKEVRKNVDLAYGQKKTYNGVKYVLIKHSFVNKFGSTIVRDATISAFNKSFQIYVREDINLQIEQQDRVIFVNGMKISANGIWETYKSNGTPDVTSRCLPFRCEIRNNKLIIVSEIDITVNPELKDVGSMYSVVDTYDIVQLESQYIYKLTKRIEALEQSNN